MKILRKDDAAKTPNFKWNKYLFKNRRLALLTGSVVAVHLFFFFFNFKNEKHPPPPKKSIVVHTFVPRPSPKPKVTTRTETSSSSKKVQKSQLSKKIEKPKPNSTSKKNEILKELNDSLKKIEPTTSPEQKNLLTFPKNIQSLQIDQTEEPETSDYFTLLAQTLKEELELPEYGDVKLELTVHNNGRVLKIRVIHTASLKNQKYLELNLPKVILPPFSEDFKNEREHTFTLTFCNET
ncbi:MAG: hypothetical protein H7A41_02940 [Chlamydiales bacterium]|nr:hypothetical protein [Chlamydiales bacterium]